MLKRHSVGSLVCLGQIKKKKADVLIDLKADWCVSRRVSVLLKALWREDEGLNLSRSAEPWKLREFCTCYDSGAFFSKNKKNHPKTQKNN